MLEVIRDPTDLQKGVGGIAIEDAMFAEEKLVFDGAADAWRAMIDQARRA